jgi:hypothetical protein
LKPIIIESYTESNESLKITRLRNPIVCSGLLLKQTQAYIYIRLIASGIDKIPPKFLKEKHFQKFRWPPNLQQMVQRRVSRKAVTRNVPDVLKLFHRHSGMDNPDVLKLFHRHSVWMIKISVLVKVNNTSGLSIPLCLWKSFNTSGTFRVTAFRDTLGNLWKMRWIKFNVYFTSKQYRQQRNTGISLFDTFRTPHLSQVLIKYPQNFSKKNTFKSSVDPPIYNKWSKVQSE